MADWFLDLFGLAGLPPEGQRIELGSRPFLMIDGMLRSESQPSVAQRQTSDSFGFKWAQRSTFESETSLAHLRQWQRDRYGAMEDADWLFANAERPLLLDAGCGAGMTALELFGPVLPRLRYLGSDISTAVDVARARFAERGLEGAFLQTDLMELPLPPASVDLILSEGVLHHTDSTEKALKWLARLLKPGGRFLFYVYRRKGPIREFTDDFVRDKLQGMSPEQSWAALEPLSRLGRTFGELDIEIDIEEPIDLLGIPAGRINLQRFFYWHVAKAFYRPDYSLDEMNHINFDWYAPRNALRQSPDEVRRWCAEAGLTIERETIEDAGICVIAAKPA